jgi:stage II sporulation protein E
MKTVMLPYQKIEAIARNYGRLKSRSIIKFFSGINNSIVLPIAFLLGRASLTGGMMPFATAVYAAIYGLSYNKILVAVAMLFGMVTKGARHQIFISAVSILLFSIAGRFIKKSEKSGTIVYAVTATVSIFIPSIIYIYFKGFLLFDFLMSLLNALIVTMLVVIFRKGAMAINDRKRLHSFSNEEVISIAIIFALALSGLSNISFFGVSVKNISCILLILIFSYKCGASAGAAIGVTAGLITSMSASISPIVIGCYAFCGLLSGLFRNLGKFGSGIGFIMGNALLTLYVNGSTNVIIFLKDIFVANIIFMIIPAKVMDIATGKFYVNECRNYIAENSGFRIKEMVIDKLNKFSATFKELSKTFNEVAKASLATDKHDISVMFDRVAERICKNCSLCYHCWDKNFFNTYQVMFKIVEVLENRGRIEAKDIPENFLEKCVKINEFVEAVNNVYEVFKVDIMWKSRMGESRGIVSEQLDGLSKVIMGIAEEINHEICYKSDIEEKLIGELSHIGIEVKDVIVHENKIGKNEVTVYHKGCGGRRECVSKIEKVISGIMEKKMVHESANCKMDHKAGVCCLKLIEEETFRVTSGIARLCRNGSAISGDNYTFMNAGSGKYLIALSDGMGTGQRAASQSKATVNLLEQFTEVGFDKDTAVKMINSVLMLKSIDDSYATIDMSVINLYDCDVEFIKIGAVPTFIKKEDRVELVRSVSLPAGILSDIETELIHKKLNNGEFIIMMTDGVYDAYKKCSENSEFIESFIEQIKSKNPQEIADIILDKAYELEGRSASDDMTVLVAKVWGKAK